MFIKKVATTGTFNKHLMGGIHTLCVGLAGCAGPPCLQPYLSLGVIQPVPMAHLSGNALVLQYAGKKES